jgi:8-oxo-dGTP pyrophosphatase MutT (NUDIX family)
MEPLMKDKRLVAAFVPYRKRGDEYEFFLQKRDANAPTNPGRYGFFGGGLDEGESMEDGFYREVYEELEYRPISPKYFSKYEHATIIFDLFIEKVDGEFESKVNVHEGEYGKFFTPQEAAREPALSENIAFILWQIAAYLAQVDD